MSPKQAREIAERDWDQDRRVDDAARKAWASLRAVWKSTSVSGARHFFTKSPRGDDGRSVDGEALRHAIEQASRADGMEDDATIQHDFDFHTFDARRLI